MNFLLENATIVSNNKTREIFRGSVRVEKDRIVAIGKKLKAKPTEKRINLDGQILIPGFVQTHVHLCQTLFRNLADDLQLLDWLKERIWPMEGAHTEKSLYASARLGIAELLSSGTTTILDMGTVRHTDAIFTAAEEMGIRAFIGKCLMDRNDCPKELREPTAQALKENLELISRWHGKANGRLRYANAPRFVISCTEGLLKDLRSLSEEKNLLVHTHASENREEIKIVQAITGKKNIAYLDHLGLANERLVLAHCVWVDDDEKTLLAKTKTKVSHCPSSNLKLASGIAPIPAFRKAGISVSLGADGAPCNNNLNMFQEMRLASLIQKPVHGPTTMTAQEVFEMATLEGAKALGLAQEIGSIEIGKHADLVAMNLNELHSAGGAADNAKSIYSTIAYAASPSNVTHTWVNGRLVYQAKSGKVGGVLSEQILQDAIRERRKLLQKI